MPLTKGSCSHSSFASEEKQQDLKACHYKISMKILLNLTAHKDYMKATKVHIIIFYKHTHTEAAIHICSEGLFFYTKGKKEERKISNIIVCNFMHYLHKTATGLHIKLE